ncbi:PAS domain-containing protein [Salinibacter ruber]|uniref:PAS domain-containing protein n=1 Tax=Salinibacter ruber TaxID=146919 RepID=UPI0020749E74|nr:PAS domain-containing protein [Salinibacter ruber]
MKGVLYVLMGWYALQVLQHGLGGARDTGLLVVCAVLPVVAAIGAESAGPVLRFLGIGGVVSTGSLALGPVPTAEALSLSAGIVTIVLMEGVAAIAHLSMRGRLHEKNEQWQGLLDHLQEAVVISKDREVEYANARAADLFGASTTDALQDYSVSALMTEEGAGAPSRSTQSTAAPRRRPSSIARPGSTGKSALFSPSPYRCRATEKTRR